MIIVADNVQVTHPQISDAVNSYSPDPLRKVVNECANKGAHILDINTGPLDKSYEKKLEFIFHTIEDITKMPLMIDSANPAVLQKALSCAKNPIMINGFSLEPFKLKEILPLAKQYDVPIVGFLLYPDSMVACLAQDRLNIAVSLFEEYTKAGLSPEKLIIDPVIAPLSWNDGPLHASETLEVIRLLPELLGFDVNMIAGLSNLITGAGCARQKSLFEATYASALGFAGLSHCLMNVNHSLAMDVVCTSKKIRNTNVPFTWQPQAQTKPLGEELFFCVYQLYFLTYLKSLHYKLQYRSDKIELNRLLKILWKWFGDHMPAKLLGLLKSQKNRLLIILKDMGISPIEFEWTDVPSVFSPEVRVSQLVFSKSEFYFSFDARGEAFFCIFSPGANNVITFQYTHSWDDLEFLFKKWLLNLAKEIETPDLWNAYTEKPDFKKKDRKDTERTAYQTTPPATSPSNEAIQRTVNTLFNKVKKPGQDITHPPCSVKRYYGKA